MDPSRKIRDQNNRTDTVRQNVRLCVPLRGLEEESRCEKSHIVNELVFKFNKREKTWLELLVCQHDTTRLSSDARDYFSSLLGKNGAIAATSTNSYHGYDNEDNDDLNYDDDGDDDGYDDDDDCSVFEVAGRISPVH